MTHEQAKQYYENSNSNVIDSKTKLLREGDNFVITFHGETIIKFFPDGRQQFWSNGQKSYTLWQRITKFSNSVICVKPENIKDMWLEKHGVGYSFTEGVIID